MGTTAASPAIPAAARWAAFPEEQIVGKLLFRLWPLDEIGPIE